MPHPDHSIDISEEAGVRSLHFGSDWVQGAMHIARPWSLELAYTREMMAGLLFQPASDWPRTALLIGLGAGSLCKFIYRHLPECQITVVEIHPGVVAAATQFFKLPDDPARLQVVIGDGARFVGETQAAYDLILVDGFGPDARPGPLDSVRFYSACKQRLAANSLLVCNLLGRSRGFQASVDRLRTAFDGRAIVFPSCDSGNAIAFAKSGERLLCSLDDMRERAGKLKKDTGLDLFSTISRLQLTQALPKGCLCL